MAIVLLTSLGEGAGVGGNTFTTAAIDTTGATLLVCAWGQGSGADAVITDSKGNTWTPLTTHSNASHESGISYSVPTSVGAGHTFTCTISAGASASLGVLAFSGTLAASPFDVENGATDSGSSITSIATGSVATAANSVTVSILSTNVNTGSEALDNGFTSGTFVDFLGGSHFTTSVWYKINAGTVNPTWTWTTAARCSTSIASFLAATDSPITGLRPAICL